MDSQKSFTVSEFCDQYRISKVHYYALKKRGEGPTELELGRRRIITPGAAQAWEQRMAQRHAEAGSA